MIQTILVIVASVAITIMVGRSYLAYLKHRKPLTAIDPNVRYSFVHHIRMVSIPTLKFRLEDKLKSAKKPQTQA